MHMNPINLMLRFILEISALISAGLWGWNYSEDLLRYILVVTIPAMLVIVWGVFNVPNDPSRSGNAPVVVSGIVRLGIECTIFAIAIWSLYSTGNTKLALIFAATVFAHYVFSYKRIFWMLRH